jgi:ferrous iron transport protein A
MNSEHVQPNKTTLMDLPVGGSARVIAVNGGGRVAQRLMEMGVVPGVAVQVVRTAPFGDPIEVKVRGYSLAMRRSEAQTIDISC